MERERKFKIVALVAVIIAVIGLSIAFAAMSRTLNINGSGNVDPANFDIYFTNLSQPTLGGEASVSGTPTLATKGVTISNMNVTLKKPKDSVVYTVDIKNDGDIDAEIENLVLPTFTSAQQQLFDFTVVYTNGGQAVSIGDTLAKGETRNVTITFKYKDITDESLLPSTAQQISLSYQIIYRQTNNAVTASGSAGQNSGNSQSNACTQYLTKDTYAVGDLISICNTTTGKSEDFYVISDNGTTVTALAKYNLLVGDRLVYTDLNNGVYTRTAISNSDPEYGIQSSKTQVDMEQVDMENFIITGVIAFANKANEDTWWGYWTVDSDPHNLKSNYGNEYPAWVFDSNSLLWGQVNNYQTYLRGLGKTSAVATLMSYEQANSLKNNDSLPTWAYENSAYWLGDAYGYSLVWIVIPDGGLSHDDFGVDGDYGVRPVITINKSEL